MTRPEYKDIIVDSLNYCSTNKGMEIYAWVIMSNHVHLIAAAKEDYNLSDILRDLKKFTSKKLIDAINSNPIESRKEWMIWMFERAGKYNTNNKVFQFWQQDNHPIELSTNEMLDQRLDYIHMNPVNAGMVYEAHHYPYSSAIDYAGGKGLVKVCFID